MGSASSTGSVADAVPTAAIPPTKCIPVSGVSVDNLLRLGRGVRLGSGAYGAVWKVNTTASQEWKAITSRTGGLMPPFVAVKVYRAWDARFGQVEARTLAWMASQTKRLGRFTPAFFDCLQMADGFLIIMEYLQGKDLETLTSPRFGVRDKAVTARLRAVVPHLAHTLVGAVIVMHKNGIIHRDIRLPNVMVLDASVQPDLAKSVRLIDMGLACARGGAVAHRIDPCTDALVGTSAYVHPLLAGYLQWVSAGNHGHPGIALYQDWWMAATIVCEVAAHAYGLAMKADDSPLDVMRLQHRLTEQIRERGVNPGAMKPGLDALTRRMCTCLRMASTYTPAPALDFLTALVRRDPMRHFLDAGGRWDEPGATAMAVSDIAGLADLPALASVEECSGEDVFAHDLP